MDPSSPSSAAYAGPVTLKTKGKKGLPVCAPGVKSALGAIAPAPVLAIRLECNTYHLLNEIPELRVLLTSHCRNERFTKFTEEQIGSHSSRQGVEWRWRSYQVV